MKKVLIITYYWYPAGGSGVQRWLKFVKYFRDFGWEPVIFTIQNGEYSVLDESLGKDIPENVETLRVPAFEPHKLYLKLSGKKKEEKLHQNFLSGGKKWSWKEKIGVFIRGNFFIPDARMFWIKPSANFIVDYLKQHKVDAIVSTGPPHSCHLIALNVKKKTNIPWIADFRDPWTGIDYFDNLMLTPIAKWLHRKLEKEVLDKCDSVVAVGESHKKEYSKITQNSIEVIPNGYDAVINPNPEKTALNSDFTLTHLGAMNESRNPEVLWQAIKLLEVENSPVLAKLKVQLVGAVEQPIFDSIEKYGVEKYVLHTPYVPYYEALEIQNRSQLLLVVINNINIKNGWVPGKIFENIASLRPIICIGPKGGDTDKIITDTQAGITVNYDEPQAMKQVLENCFERYKNGTLANVYNDNIPKYSRKELTARMSELLDTITKTN